MKSARSAHSCLLLHMMLDFIVLVTWFLLKFPILHPHKNEAFVWVGLLVLAYIDIAIMCWGNGVSLSSSRKMASVVLPDCHPALSASSVSCSAVSSLACRCFACDFLSDVPAELHVSPQLSCFGFFYPSNAKSMGILCMIIFLSGAYLAKYSLASCNSTH